MITRSLLLASALAVITATAAQAQGWNISLMGGETFDPHLSTGATSLNMNDGFNAGGRIGYDLDDWTHISGLTLAADVFYTQSHYRGTDAARLSTLSFMGDLIYRVDLGLPVGVYGGAGVGGVRDAVNSFTVDNNATVFAWQALGGVDYQIAPETKLFAEYRYQNAHDANLLPLNHVGYTSNNVSVGVKLDL